MNYEVEPMDCKEIESYLHLYLDGEFDGRESAAMEEHLVHCGACRALVNAEINFQNALRTRMNPPPKISDARRRRITESVMGQGQRRESRFLLSWPGFMLPAAGLAAAALLAVLLMPKTQSQDVDGFIQETVAAHESELPVEVSGDEASIMAYIRARTRFQPQPPIQNADAKLVGARLTRVGNQMAVIYRYQYKDHPISVVQTPSDGTSDDQVKQQLVRFSGERSGHGVTMFENGGYRNAAIADIPSGELLRLVPASY